MDINIICCVHARGKSQIEIISFVELYVYHFIARGPFYLDLLYNDVLIVKVCDKDLCRTLATILGPMVSLSRVGLAAPSARRKI